MIESVTVAVKKGTSASGKDTLTLKVLESFEINSKRARCLAISIGLLADMNAKKKGRVKECTPVSTPVPDARTNAHINVRDTCTGRLLFVRIGKTIRAQYELVVRSNGRLFVADKNDGRHTTFPLRRAIDGCEGGGMYGLRGVVGTGWKALEDWILPVAWLE
jgi:hypothetical protein